MKKIFIIPVLLLSMIVSGYAQDDIVWNNKVPRTDSIKGDLNGDGITDLLVVHYDNSKRKPANNKIQV